MTSRPTIVTLQVDYEGFLRHLATRPRYQAATDYPTLEHERVQTFFGQGDRFSFHLQQHGFTAHDLYVNNETMQRAWLEMYAPRSAPPPSPGRGWRLLQSFRRRLGQTPLFHLRRLLRPALRLLDTGEDWQYEILETQLKTLRPAIVYSLSVDGLRAERLRALCDSIGAKLVGQIAAPIPPGTDLHAYDLLITSLPTYLEAFRAQGLRAEFWPLGFDERIAEAIPPQVRDIPLSFIGSIGPHHKDRRALLEQIARELPLRVWGQGFDTLPKRSPLRQAWQGAVYGREMFTLLARSRITLNHHIRIAGDDANNLRLFEATGMGAALVTDAKRNIEDYFRADEEVITYASAGECIAILRDLLTPEGDAEAVARAGHARTLRDHTVSRRIESLIPMLDALLPHPDSP